MPFVTSLAIGTALAASVTLAAMDSVPNFNIEPSCRAAAQEAGSADYAATCRNTEQKARDELVRQWPRVNAAEKAQCVPGAAAGGEPTYTELLTCIEVTRDVRQLRGNTEPTTTGQGSR